MAAWPCVSWSNFCLSGARRPLVLDVKRPPEAKGAWAKRGGSQKSRVDTEDDVFSQFAQDIEVLFTDTQEAEDAAAATIAAAETDQDAEE